jgi:hypothetical protein
MAAEQALALVVRGTDWSETSRITTLFTREFGKIRAYPPRISGRALQFRSGVAALRRGEHTTTETRIHCRMVVNCVTRLHRSVRMWDGVGESMRGTADEQAERTTAPPAAMRPRAADGA